MNPKESSQERAFPEALKLNLDLFAKKIAKTHAPSSAENEHHDAQNELITVWNAITNTIAAKEVSLREVGTDGSLLLKYSGLSHRYFIEMHHLICASLLVHSEQHQFKKEIWRDLMSTLLIPAASHKVHTTNNNNNRTTRMDGFALFINLFFSYQETEGQGVSIQDAFHLLQLAYGFFLQGVIQSIVVPLDGNKYSSNSELPLEVKRLLLPFLRRSSLFMGAYGITSNPTFEKQLQTISLSKSDIEEFESLVSLLHLNKDLPQEKIRYSSPVQPNGLSFPYPLKLVPLDDHFEELLLKYKDAKCPKCHLHPKTPALCMFCGRILCVNSSCCPDSEGNPRGECVEVSYYG
jgi:hypothetical protein